MSVVNTCLTQYRVEQMQIRSTVYVDLLVPRIFQVMFTIEIYTEKLVFIREKR